MKKTIFFLLMILASAVSFVSCSDDEGNVGGKNDFTSGKWYLVTYNDERCTHGEYLKFSKDKMEWNSRKAGNNTSYRYRVNGNQIICTLISGDAPDITFYVQSCENGAAVTTSNDNMIRVWSRKPL